MSDYYSSYLDDQVGMGRRGYGGISQVYIGAPNQRGHGIGSFLGGLFRRVLPFLKRGANALGKEMVRTGMNVASDVIHRDTPIKESLKTRIRESGNNLKRKAEEQIDTLMHGTGYMPGDFMLTPQSINSHQSMHNVPAIKNRPKKESQKKRRPRTTPRKTKKKTAQRKKKPTSAKKNSRKKKLRTVSDIFNN